MHRGSLHVRLVVEAAEMGKRTPPGVSENEMQYVELPRWNCHTTTLRIRDTFQSSGLGAFICLGGYGGHGSLRLFILCFTSGDPVTCRTPLKQERIAPALKIVR